MQRCRALLNSMIRFLIGEEGGVQAIEFLGFLPMVLLTQTVAWQFFYVGYTGVVASGAAREGAVTAARAGSDMGAIDAAVRGASRGFDGRRWWTLLTPPCETFTGAPVTVQVQLEVPHVTLPFIGPLDIYPRVTAVSTARCEVGFSLP